MEYNLSGRGFLQPDDSIERYPVQYWVRSYREKSDGLFTGSGNIAPDERHLLLRLMTSPSHANRYRLVLEDGRSIPILLRSSNGEILPAGDPG